LANDFGGIPRNDCMGFNGTGYYGSSPNHGPFSNGDTWQYDSPIANPNSIANNE
jgi:hypothetical protein